MQSSAITTSVRYVSDGTTCAWPLPFPATDSSAIGAIIQDSEGRERTLKAGSEYIIKDNCLMAVVPAGHSICIWLEQPVQTAVTTAASAAMATAATPATTQLAAEEPATSTASSSEINALAAELRELKALQENALVQARLAEEDRQVKRIEAAGEAAAKSIADTLVEQSTIAKMDIAGQASMTMEEANAASAKAVAESQTAMEQAQSAQSDIAKAMEQLAAAKTALEQTIANAQKTLDEAKDSVLDDFSRMASNASLSLAASETEATERIRKDCDLHLACINQEGSYTDNSGAPAGTIISLPSGLKYYPGLHMLRITYNGMTLVNGVHYEELPNVVEPGAPSNAIKILFDAAEGMLWSFWIVAANASGKALGAAKRAHESARHAEEWAFNARQYAADVDEAGKVAAEHARHADAWRKCSAQSAAAAHGMAVCAWKGARKFAKEAAHSAWQASIVSRKPGIAAVRDKNELRHATSGLYIVNPYLVQTPTMFMGVWPVRSLAEMAWDGIFFLGPKYPDQPVLPPAPQPPAKPVCPCPPLAGDQPAAETPVWGPCDHNHANCPICN